MRNKERGELILGMSLAELVLLLLFALMLVYVAEEGEGGGQPIELTRQELIEQNNRLRAEVQELAKSLKISEQQRTELQMRLEELRRMVGAHGTGGEEIQRAIQALKRGHPACDKKENTLLSIIARDGLVSVQVVGNPPREVSHLISNGSETNDPEFIERINQELYKYERYNRCRFDYRLQYLTDSDYRSAREQFENYFYPAGIRRLQ